MNPKAGRSWLFLSFSLTIFVSAFLLFQVQPLISKSILPWFGGSPAVWTTCMLFFQVVLFAGYAYAHCVIRYLPSRAQVVLHIVLLVAALFLLPIMPDAQWKPSVGGVDPTFRIVGLLAVTVGLPYFLLSSTGPLVQSWFSKQLPGSSPYRLYALSNIGSLLALVSYPFVVEPIWATVDQSRFWSWGFGLFTVLCSLCAIRLWSRVRADASSETANSSNGAIDSVDDVESDRPSTPNRVLWVTLAMAPSIMLLATTNQVCQDIAVVPFLWVLPLGLYLLSFILCFDSDRWYSRLGYSGALGVSLVLVSSLTMLGVGMSLISQVIIYFATLFICCMVCHGELVKLKPRPEYLTSFYLSISAGGAAGGLFVGLVAPRVFNTFVELQVGIVMCCVLTLVVWMRDWFKEPDRTKRPKWNWGYAVFALAATGAVWQVRDSSTVDNAIAVSRNFYGILRIEEYTSAVDPTEKFIALRHGNVMHGMQFVSEERRRWPTTYFGEEAGVGLVLKNFKPNQPKRVGIVGLGAGTVAVYGQPGDYYRFYELDPDVLRLTTEHFTYLQDSQAETDVIVGDGRISLEHEAAQEFDILVLDAFSGDAVPVHLLTKEALGIYRRHLKPDGVLMFNISNQHFDLSPVVAALADEAGMTMQIVISKGSPEKGTNPVYWSILSSQTSDVLHIEAIRSVATKPGDRRVLWTDRYSNLFGILKGRAE